MTNDKVREALTSGDAYDEARVKSRHLFERLSAERKLKAIAGLQFLLATFLPLYPFLPRSDLISTVDPTAAAPKIAILAAFGLIMTTIGAVAIASSIYCRLDQHPLSDARAREVVTREAFGGCIGLGTGGLSILIAGAVIALGLGGGVEWYVSTVGRNPFAAAPIRLTIGSVSSSAFVLAVIVFFLAQYASFRLNDHRRRTGAVM